MTTSGVHTLSVSRDEIILAALEDIGAYAPGMETPTAGEINGAAMRLNMMVKAWQAASVGLWLNQWLYLPVQQGKQYYSIGPSGDHCSAGMKWQTLNGTVTSGDLTVTLTDATGVANGDAIGIVTDSDYVYWTTVNGAPIGNVITLTAAITDDAADGNLVMNYTSIADRPLAINSVALWKPTGNTITIAGTTTASTGTEIPLSVLSRDEYFSLPDKLSEGSPTSYYHDYQLGNGELYVWPIETDTDNHLILNVRIPIQVFSVTADTPDFPAEWFDALHFGLAVRLCPAYKVPINDYQRLKEMAQIALADADGFDREQQTSIFLQPSSR